jgi:hypothetical protein
MSSSTKREASWSAGSKRSNAARLQKASVSAAAPRAHAGFQQALERPGAADLVAVHQRVTITWRPGCPDSKRQTPSVPVLPARQAEMSGADSSKDADKLIP